MSRTDRPEVKMIKGTTTEEKFTNLERTLRQIALRVNKTAVVVVPPQVIVFGGIRVTEGSIELSCLFPLAGKITKAMIDSEARPDATGKVSRDISIKIGTDDMTGLATISKVVKAGKQSVDINVPIIEGSKFTLTSSDANYLCVSIIFEYDKVAITAMTKDEIVAKFVEDIA